MRLTLIPSYRCSGKARPEGGVGVGRACVGGIRITL